jgi:hypothetical protein
MVLSYLLPVLTIPKGPLAVRYEFGVSSKASDGDNFIKTLQDTLCEKYGFNDRDIYSWEIERKIVLKGEEYAAFELLSYKSRRGSQFHGKQTGNPNTIGRP